jgi:RimJ/RimL family protein N-acetyltransferase
VNVNVNDVDVDVTKRNVEALFTHDVSGRLLLVNETTADGSLSGKPAPRFYLGRSRAGCVWRFRASSPASVVRELEEVVARELPWSGDVERDRDPIGRSDYARILRSVARDDVWSGPFYGMTNEQDEHDEQHRVVRIDSSNAELLLAKHLGEWIDVALEWQPMFVSLNDDGDAVALCASVRRTNDAHTAGVETAPSFRRQGFALAAVRAWLRGVRALGLLPIYSTSWDNLASQGLAARLGLVMLGTDFHLS